MTFFPKKENAPNFSNPAEQNSYVNHTSSGKELMQKELDVNREEQILLKQRIQFAKSLMNDLPSFAPQYTTLLTQIQMDQIELDELKIREMNLIDQLTTNL